MSNIWNCHICGDKRPYHRISTRQRVIEPGLEISVSYCNDKPTCIEESKTFDFGMSK